MKRPLVQSRCTRLNTSQMVKWIGTKLDELQKDSLKEKALIIIYHDTFSPVAKMVTIRTF